MANNSQEKQLDNLKKRLASLPAPSKNGVTLAYDLTLMINNRGERSIIVRSPEPAKVERL